MKIFSPASSILLAACILLAGCGSLGLPDPTRSDEVPDAVKAAPRLVQSAPPLTGNEKWPRLGDVPPRPKDFSPKPVSDHYMNELEYDRTVDQDAKEKLEALSPTGPSDVLTGGAVQSAPLSASAPVSPKE